MQPTGFLRATLLRRQAGGLGHWRCKSSLAEVTARVLSEGKANSTTGHGAFPGPSLSTLEELTASMPPQPVSILMLTSWARVTKPEGRLLQAKFIRNELIARRAHILTLLHSMPEPLGNQPALASWVNVYWERLRDLLERPEPQTHEEERIFAELCKERNAQIGSIGTAAEETMLVEALQRVQQERGSEWWATHPEERHAVDRHLDAIFLARIGLRFLLEFHVACDTPREGFAGVLETRCSPVAQLQSLAIDVQSAVTAEHGDAPRIEVVGDGSQTFTFVPSHIAFVVGTLLTNSSVATLRHHHRQQAAGRIAPGEPLPPVKAIVAVSDEAVQLKLEDRAGGIKRSSLINVWSYRALDSSWWRPKDGLSLPLARLYCIYFGGDVSLVGPYETRRRGHARARAHAIAKGA